MEWKIRPFRASDDDAVRMLNAANVPEVGQLDDERMAFFVDEAPVFWVAEVAGADGRPSIGAMLIGLRHGSRYWSANYRWFADRHEHFAYVDRIALAPACRGTGLADALYGDFRTWALGESVGVLCAEVNVVPPNPRSMAFHERHGFVAVAVTEPYGPPERVAMLEARIG